MVWQRQLRRAARVRELAQDLGLIDPAGRDLETGRGMLSKLVLIAALPIDWEGIEGQLWLSAIWPTLLTVDRSTVRAWVSWLTRSRRPGRTRPNTRLPARSSETGAASE